VKMRKLKEEKDKMLMVARNKLTSNQHKQLLELEEKITQVKVSDAEEELKNEVLELSRKKLTSTQRTRILEIDDIIAPLEKFLADAAYHRRQIKLEIGYDPNFNFTYE